MGNILTIVILAAGLIGVIICLRSLARNRSSMKWPTTPGRVLSSMVKTVGFGDDMRQRAEVIYEYTVGEQKLQSGRVSYADDYSDAKLTEAEISEKCRKYSVGEEVTVYFDPKDPRESVLEPKANTTIYLAMAVCFLVMGGALLARTAAFGSANVTKDQIVNPLGDGEKPGSTVSNGQ